MRKFLALKIDVDTLKGTRLGVPALIDALKRHQAETAAELDALMPAVLERAFRGVL